MDPRVSIIAALGKNRALGKDNQLLWRIPEDLKRFKELTMGHVLIMGRKTYESIGRPLPGRTTIVITRNPEWSAEGVTISHSLEEALMEARKRETEEIFICGGGEIYRQALAHTNRLYLTLIDEEKEADAFFPPFEHIFGKEIFREEHTTPERIHLVWVNLERP